MSNEIKAFECGFCRKIYRTERGVTKHEARCGHNPENNRPCFECSHLTKKQVWGFRYDEETKFDLFYCAKKEIFLYPPITGHKKNFLDTEETQEPMPKECEDFTTDTIFRHPIN